MYGILEIKIRFVKRDEGKAIFNKDYTIYEGESDNQFYFEAGNASNNTVAIDFIEINRVTLKSFNKICYVIKKLKTKHMKKD